MTLTGASAAGLPKEYHLNLAPAPTPIYVFSEDAAGAVALEGAVKHRGDVGPADGHSAEYRALVRRRTADADTHTRGVQQYHDVQMPSRPAAASRVISTITGKVRPSLGLPSLAPSLRVAITHAVRAVQRKDVRRVANEPPEKRERMDQDKLEEILFDRFERRPNYTLKELIDITQQPLVRTAALAERCRDCVCTRRTLRRCWASCASTTSAARTRTPTSSGQSTGTAPRTSTRRPRPIRWLQVRRSMRRECTHTVHTSRQVGEQRGSICARQKQGGRWVAANAV